MPLTQAQKTTLKAAIAANTNTIAGVAINAIPNSSDGNFAIAGWYNQLGVAGTHTVWKTAVSITEIGDKLNGAELAGLTTGNQTRLQTVAMFSAGGVNPSLADRRAFFDDIFSGAGGTTTRANLLALWKRLCTFAEKLFATGTGSDASPATLVFVGDLTGNDVQSARNEG